MINELKEKRDDQSIIPQECFFEFFYVYSLLFELGNFGLAIISKDLILYNFNIIYKLIEAIFLVPE